MRRTLIVLACMMTLLFGSASIAQAAPPDSTATAAGSQTVTAKRSAATGIKFAAVNHAGLQPPPGGGCDIYDVSLTVHWTSVDGVLATTNSEWSGKTICTTTAPGQSMAGITEDTSLWFNSHPIASGRRFTCVNCNLANSTGAHPCGGVTCSGTYWVGATVTLTLPAGYRWTSWPSNCIFLSDTALTCSAVTGTVFIPVNPH